MSEFPCSVYQCPGNNIVKGGTFRYVNVDNQADLDGLLGSGWFMTVREAMDAYNGVDEQPEPELEPEVEIIEEVVEPEPKPEPEPEAIDAEVEYPIQPTREELEMKANELGIKYDGRTTDKKLQQRIEDYLDRMEAEAREG